MLFMTLEFAWARRSFNADFGVFENIFKGGLKIEGPYCWERKQ